VWRTDFAPYQRAIMDACSDPAVREVVFMKSAQVGWTEILNNVIGYHIDQDASPILLMQPTLDMAEAWSKDRLAPMIRDTPALSGKIADPKSRDSGNTLLHKQFSGGHLTVVGANAPSGLASRPIRILLCDEVDRFPASAGTEGDPIDLARKRTTTFWNRKVLMGSTPTVKGASRIEAAFEQSDMGYYFVPCPHCEEFQRLLWSQLKWDDGKPETARYVCASCGTLLDDNEKTIMVRRGEWRATKDFDGIRGFHMSELYSPWVSWPDLATAFLRAKKLPETLKTWINTALGETWEEDGSTVDPESLLSRREPYGPDQVPQGVLAITMGGDVQADRVEMQLLGWGADEECWILEQHVIRGDPDKPEIWKDVDNYLKSSYETEDGRTLPIEAAAIDSGGLSTQSVYQYVVARKRWRIWAVKGMAGAGRLAWPKAASKTKSRAMVFILGVDTIKSLLYGRIAKVAEPGPGYLHLPATANDEFCRQLTSERALKKYVRGRPSIVWEPRSSGIKQEAQDCWVYGYAAMLGRGGPSFLARLARRHRPARGAADQRTNVPSNEDTGSATLAPPDPPRPPVEQVPTFDAPKRRTAPARRSWVKRWRD